MKFRQIWSHWTIRSKVTNDFYDRGSDYLDSVEDKLLRIAKWKIRTIHWFLHQRYANFCWFGRGKISFYYLPLIQWIEQGGSIVYFLLYDLLWSSLSIIG